MSDRMVSCVRLFAFRKDISMNNKDRKRQIAYEVLMILGSLALLTFICRLWPILLLIILGIFVAAIRLLFLSGNRVDPVEPQPLLPAPISAPTESDLRKLALMLILLRAGLSLDLGDLKRVGRPAVLMAFVPATFEVLAVVLFAPMILGVTRVEAAVMGAVLGAVSPAVVVPRMVKLMEEGRGTKQGVPQMIMAGASCDDVYVIVLFSTFTRMAQGVGARLADFAAVPVSIVLGAFVGAVSGCLLSKLFERGRMETTMRIILALAVGCLLIALEGWLDGKAAFSGLLGVMGMAVMLRRCGDVQAVSAGVGKLWRAAEVMLFVLVGAAVDIRYTMQAGAGAVLLIALALVIRSVGVCLCVAGTKLTKKERLFCVIAYLPKATVQAAIGATPLAMGLPCGNLVLSVAVLAILLTAPLGAIGMDATADRLLQK
mgnify:CR=1 FL=1